MENRLHGVILISAVCFEESQTTYGDGYGYGYGDGDGYGDSDGY